MMMSLELKSTELKKLVSKYETDWFLGHISGLIINITSDIAKEEIGGLSSPLRQLYFLGGLVISSNTSEEKSQYDPEEWKKIIILLNEIEQEYDKLFFSEKEHNIDSEWKKIRNVAMPSFLSYFNQGPLNYEEQVINWVEDLFSVQDEIIENVTGLKTKDFIKFYNTLDDLLQHNFQCFMSPNYQVKENWQNYTKIKLINTAPPELGFTPPEKQWAFYHFLQDPGIIYRFFTEEIVSDDLPLEKVNTILGFLDIIREERDYLYYTSTKPGNPLYSKPIVDIGDNMFQVFEIKQVIHAIEDFLEQICTTTKDLTTKYTDTKGKLLESNIVKIFKDYLEKDFEIYEGYYVDGCEQDILILWKECAFIIEAKGYSIREPLRDPNRAFPRIKDDFEKSIGYGYLQTKRVEEKFINGELLILKDSKGNVIKEIDTTKYEYDFSIIVNINSFGQIQNNLSLLIKIDVDSEVYPWAVKIDDLEVFLLTLKAMNKPTHTLVDYLLLREDLHGKLICSDELEICGCFLNGILTEKLIKENDNIVTSPEFTSIFDDQYNKGMGFKNEKLWEEKKSGKYKFWG